MIMCYLSYIKNLSLLVYVRKYPKMKKGKILIGIKSNLKKLLIKLKGMEYK